MDTQSRSQTQSPLIDAFGRRITYLRLSVTDRCDLRCHYCMDEQPDFLPREDLLSYEELAASCDSFIARGVSKIRITGGEPLVRRDVITLIEALGQRLGNSALNEITLTTNGTQLERHADQLAAAAWKGGVGRGPPPVPPIATSRAQALALGCECRAC